MTNKKLDLRVKDNFLNDRDFWFLKDLFFNEKTIYYPHWQIADASEPKQKDNYDDWFLVHPVYNDHLVLSTAYEEVRNRLVNAIQETEKTQFNIFTRIKVNMYPHTHELQEHMMHRDATHTLRLRGAIYCLNTCDGYTGFSDGTKIESVENRLILFDSLEPHHSTSTSDAQVRMNINVNYV
tara:strand:- start:628 stop:1170 length:543 start_codon:yes stop_codon:yes gene_type:complete